LKEGKILKEMEISLLTRGKSHNRRANFSVEREGEKKRELETTGSKLGKGKNYCTPRRSRICFKPQFSSEIFELFPI